jgi:hypothetical protein
MAVDNARMWRRELMYKRIINWLEHNKPTGFSIRETFSNHPEAADAEYHFTAEAKGVYSFRLVFSGGTYFVCNFSLQFQFEKVITPTRIFTLHSFKKRFSDVDDEDIITFSNDVELLVRMINEQSHWQEQSNKKK